MRPQSLPDLFRSAVSRRPDAVAVSDGSLTLSYRSLDTASDALAARLIAAGVGHGDLVGLFAGRDAGMAVAVLGILKAGAGYAPLDPGYPVDRLRSMIDDAELSTFVGDPTIAERSGLDIGRVLSPHDGADHATVPTMPVGSDDPAYVIYTSGSTGTPKGCVITHGNVLALLDGALPLFDIGPDDRWALFHSMCFDVSVWELWAAWATGAGVVMIPAEMAAGGEDWIEFLAAQHVTVLCQVPSVFRALVLAHEHAGRPSLWLRYVIFAGESIDLDVVDRFAKAVEHPPRMVNMYGITEITVHATFKELAGAQPVRSPIGVALPHLRIDLRDPDGIPVADGQPGEMWVGGPSVATGYLRRPELTAERFVTIDGRRWYRSGDLARRLSDGGLEYLGRIDQQIKHRGFRIEPGEIEAALRSHPVIRDAAVALTTTASGGTLLVACVAADDTTSPAELRAHLSRILPHHMIPSRFMNVAALPQTPSGKLDRSAIAALTSDA